MLDENTDYQEIFLNKERLAAAIIDEATAQFKPEARERIADILPAIAHDIAYNGIPQDVIGELLQGDGEVVKYLCKGCKGVCCIKSHPIGVSIVDALNIADALNTSVKIVIKKYLHKHPHPNGLSNYAIRKTQPCGFFNNGRCTIYDARPYVCRIYPCTAEGDKIGLGIEPYCRLPFKATVMHADVLITRKLLDRDAPEIVRAMKILANDYYPSEVEYAAMSQVEQLKAIQGGAKRLKAMAFGGIK